MPEPLYRKEQNRTADIALCLLSCLPALVIFLVVSFYNHPIGDDFWCTSMVQKYGFWNAQLRLYDIVPPRYLELMIGCLTPLSFGNFSGYKFIPVLFILLFICVVMGFIGALSGGKRLALKEKALLALLFVAWYLSVLPGIAEGIYWTSALVVYHTGILLFIVWCNYSLKWYCIRPKPSYVVLSSLCLAGMLGCNELISAIMLIILAVIAGYRLVGGKKGINSMLIVQFIVLALCVLFILKFHGTANRYSLVRTERSGRLFYSLGYSLVVDGYYIGKCLINPFFWAMGLAGLRLIRHTGVDLWSPYRSLIIRYRVPFLIIWAVILAVIPFTIIYITGDKPPLRICNMIVFFFLFGLYGSIDWLGARVAAWRYLPLAVFLLVITGLLLPNNVSLGWRDFLAGNTAKYDKGWNRRYELIRQCKSDTCILHPLQEVPFIFRFEPDYTDPHISEYFRKTVIIQQ